MFNCFAILAAQNTDYKSSIDSLMNYFQQNNAFSGSVLLQKNDKIIYQGEFNKFQNNNGLYRIGSITKIFTSMIVFQLVEEGKLSLDTKLSQFYPMIKGADLITVGHMLNHTSGIYDYLSWDDYYQNKVMNYTRDDILKVIYQGSPEFKPGKDSVYSNSNYVLLGFIVEKITGKSFDENIKIRIAEPIGLSNTYAEISQSDYVKRNSCYIYNGEIWKNEPETSPTFTLAAGSMVSSTNDLAKLMQNLFNGHLVSPSSVEQMKRTNVQTGIGYGLLKTPFHKKDGYGHSGRVDEFYSFAGYLPEDSLAIVILSNGTNMKLNDIVLGVVSKYYNTKYVYPDFKTFADSSAASTELYTGIYKAQLAGLITIGKFEVSKAGKNHLFVSLYEESGKGEKVLLERKSENNFYARKYNSEFNFTIDKKGKVTGIQMKQGNQSIKSRKVK